MHQVQQLEHSTVSVWKDLVVLSWHGPVVEGELDIFARQLERTSAIERRACGMLALIRAGAPLLDLEGRKLVSTFYADHSAMIAAHATAIEGGGFWGSAVRSVAMAVVAVDGRLDCRPFPSRIFDTGRDAMSWLCRETGKLPLDTQLAVNALRGLANLQRQPIRRSVLSLRPSRRPFF